MAKQHRRWNQSCYEQRIKDGRGCGEGATYQPWFFVQDFSSYGLISRVQGWKTGRVHHFMSGLEIQYFFLLEWSDEVTDIREQYPMLDVFTTLEIAVTSGIKHPYDIQSGFPYVLTSDFLVNTTEGLVARTIKMSNELDDYRVREKLEIERRFWNSRGVCWKLVTEKEINRQRAKNIEWLHSCKTLNGLPYDGELLDSMLTEITGLYLETGMSILDICRHVDNVYTVSSGMGLRLFRYLAANKVLAIDINKPLDLSAPRALDTYAGWTIKRVAV